MAQRPLPYPELILYNGKIRTFASNGSTCEALACSGSRIVATGNSDDIRRFAGPETQTIDLQGRTAIPGLTDTHVHLSEKGTAEMKLVDCRDFYVDVSSVASFSHVAISEVRDLHGRSQLNHPNVVKFLGLYNDDNLHEIYLVMVCLKGVVVDHKFLSGVSGERIVA